MSWGRGQSSGWTAFDRKQRKKNSLVSEFEKDPFPPVGGSDWNLCNDRLVKKNNVLVKPFSSVLLPSQNFPPLKEVKSNRPTVADSDSGGKNCGTSAQEVANAATKKLKDQHPWAENSLIEDILAGVNNDVHKAAILLETMASAVNFEVGEVSSDPGAAISDYILCEGKIDGSLKLEKVEDDIPIPSSVVGYLKDNDKDLEDVNASSGEKFSDDGNLSCKLGLLNSVPVESEWEEDDDDDIYLSHRKDALKTMRSASRHSKAAANAFLRGDHFSAQQHSMKARDEWHTAEELNSKAATKILDIRNSENDIWRLDLHGLHAAEAVQALQEHLIRLERHGFSKNSASSNGVKQNGLAHSTLGSLNNSMDGEILDKQAPIRLRSTALHVITGIGNHSRGQASLPTAVRSYLNENRYRFEEMRPGVITVWPKFRQS